MSSTECGGHICPKCKVMFAHAIEDGDVSCLDMKKCVRHCEDCKPVVETTLAMFKADLRKYALSKKH